MIRFGFPIVVGMPRTGSNLDPTDEKRALLLTALQQRGMDLANVSRSLGRNHAYLHQYIFRGKPQYLPEAERATLSEWTGLSQDQIGRRVVAMSPQKPGSVVATPPRSKGERVVMTPFGGATGLKRGVPVVPIYAAAQGGKGHLIITFDRIDEMAPPDDLVRVRDAYGILIVGDSMVPALRPGDIAWVNPHKPPERDTEVVLYHVPPDGTAEAIVKTLTGFSDTNWRLRQYQPPREWSESRADWTVCHRIVGKKSVR